jgi:hypothetical protein
LIAAIRAGAGRHRRPLIAAHLVEDRYGLIHAGQRDPYVMIGFQAAIDERVQDWILELRPPPRIEWLFDDERGLEAAERRRRDVRRGIRRASRTRDGKNGNKGEHRNASHDFSSRAPAGLKSRPTLSLLRPTLSVGARLQPRPRRA